jgi:nucleotide-binding universal stress UspA family protein
MMIQGREEAQMKTIVLGYDESPEAGRALEKTVELAKALSATVIVTSVAPVMHLAGRGIGPYDPADPPERHRELARDATAILTEQGIAAKAVTGLGKPGHTIVELADQENAELIVLGMSHHPHLSRILGSVSEDVAHHAHCDVLLVH